MSASLDTADLTTAAADDADRQAREQQARDLRAVIDNRAAFLKKTKDEALAGWEQETATERALLAADESAYAALRARLDGDAIAFAEQLGHGVRVGDVEVAYRRTLDVLDLPGALASFVGLTTAAGEPLVRMALNERAVLTWLQENPDQLDNYPDVQVKRVPSARLVAAGAPSFGERAAEWQAKDEQRRASRRQKIARQVAAAAADPEELPA